MNIIETGYQNNGNMNGKEQPCIKVTSNRLSHTVKEDELTGEYRVVRSMGGLATALQFAFEEQDGYATPVWIGWPGTLAEEEDEQEGLEEALRHANGEDNFNIRAVHLDTQEYEGYYLGYCNDRIWMICHDMSEKSTHNWNNETDEDIQWETYKNVNRKFAAEAVNQHNTDDRYWVQDYHLLLMPKYMRELTQDSDLNISFYLHIPFPEEQSFTLLPKEQRVDLIEGLLANSTIFFQTPEDVEKFILAVGYTIGPDEFTLEHPDNEHTIISYQGRKIVTGPKPIGIDTESFVSQATDHAAEMEAERSAFRREVGGRKIAFSVARLDPSKGIPERMQAYDKAVTESDELKGNLALIEVVAPGRRGVKAYDDLYNDIHRLRDDINERHLREYGIDNSVVLYPKGIYDIVKLLSLYAEADIAAITPRRDGRNLVMDEFAAVKKPGSVAVYSAGAGAARDYTGAITEIDGVPLDGGSVGQVAQALHVAYDMLVNAPEEVVQRHMQMRDFVTHHTVKDWVQSIKRDANL